MNHHNHQGTARQRLRELVSTEMVALMRDLYPDTLPDTLQDSREIAIRIGQQSLIRFLEQVAKEGEQRGSMLTRSVLGTARGMR